MSLIINEDQNDQMRRIEGCEPRIIVRKYQKRYFFLASVFVVLAPSLTEDGIEMRISRLLVIV